MSRELIRRRAMMAGGGEVDPYEGVEYGKAIAGGDTSFYYQSHPNFCVSPKYRVFAGHVYQYKQGSGGSWGMGVWNAQGGRIANYYPTSGVRTLTMMANAHTAQATFYTPELDNCFLYDQTAGVYLFKGENV